MINALLSHFQMDFKNKSRVVYTKESLESALSSHLESQSRQKRKLDLHSSSASPKMSGALNAGVDGIQAAASNGEHECTEAELKRHGILSACQENPIVLSPLPSAASGFTCQSTPANEAGTDGALKAEVDFLPDAIQANEFHESFDESSPRQHNPICLSPLPSAAPAADGSSKADDVLPDVMQAASSHAAKSAPRRGPPTLRRLHHAGPKCWRPELNAEQDSSI